MATTTAKSWASIASKNIPIANNTTSLVSLREIKVQSKKPTCIVCMQYTKFNPSFIPNYACYGINKKCPGSNKRIPTRCCQHYKEYCASKLCDHLTIEECQKYHDHRYICWFKHI